MLLPDVAEITSITLKVSGKLSHFLTTDIQRIQ